MKIASTSHFDRKLAKRIKGKTALKEKVSKSLKLLVSDVANSSLKTHKLKGKRSEEYSVFIEENLRIIFQIIGDTILLVDIITHDEY